MSQYNISKRKWVRKVIEKLDDSVVAQPHEGHKSSSVHNVETGQEKLVDLKKEINRNSSSNLVLVQSSAETKSECSESTIDESSSQSQKKKNPKTSNKIQSPVMEIIPLTASPKSSKPPTKPLRKPYQETIQRKHAANKIIAFFKGIQDRGDLQKWLGKPEAPVLKDEKREKLLVDPCLYHLLYHVQDVSTTFIKPELHFPLRSFPLFVGPIQDKDTPVILIVGGINPTNKHDLYATGNMLLRYDPSKNQLNKYSMMPVPRHNHQCIYLNGNIYVIGGFDSRLTFKGKLIATRTCFRYNLKSYTWTRRSDMKEARVYHGAVVFENEIYALGGKNERGQLLNSVEKFDDKKNEWIELKPAMCCPRMTMAVATYKGKIWVAGGLVLPPQESGFCLLRLVERFSPEEKAWTVMETRMPFPMSFPKLISTKSSLFLIGGAVLDKKNKISLLSTKTVYRFDEATVQWQPAGDLQSHRHDSGVVAVGNSIYVIGGLSTAKKSVTDDIEVYNATINTSTKIRDLPLKVCGSAVIVLPTVSDI